MDHLLREFFNKVVYTQASPIVAGLRVMSGENSSPVRIPTAAEIAHATAYNYKAATENNIRLKRDIVKLQAALALAQAPKRYNRKFWLMIVIVGYLIVGLCATQPDAPAAHAAALWSFAAHCGVKLYSAGRAGTESITAYLTSCAVFREQKLNDTDTTVNESLATFVNQTTSWKNNTVEQISNNVAIFNNMNPDGKACHTYMHHILMFHRPHRATCNARLDGPKFDRTNTFNAPNAPADSNNYMKLAEVIVCAAMFLSVVPRVVIYSGILALPLTAAAASTAASTGATMLLYSAGGQFDFLFQGK